VPRVAFILVALAATAITACGAPDELPRGDGEQLALARDRVVGAIETERQLRSSPEAAERLHARVRKIVASGALEAEQLDEFGLAALGELGLAVPSLVIVDRQRIPRRLDREALRIFLAEATSDPTVASKRPASVEVRRIADLLAAAGADADTDIPVARQTAAAYVGDLESRLRPTWPDLADQLADVRADL
jgi:hypothetical protein